MNFKTSDGLELYFESGGKGIPCVFLHGGPGYWSKSFQHFSRNLLEESLRIVYLDQRGCGRSEHSPIQDYSLKRLIDDIEELREFLEIGEWTVIGHSFGGILAVNYAHLNPERTKGLILSNVTLNMFLSFEHQIRKGSEILGIEVKQLSTRSVHSYMESYYSILTQLLEGGEYFQFQYMEVEVKKTLDLIDREGLNSDPKFQDYVFSTEEYFQDFITLTGRIHKPVLVITGEQDHAVGPEHHLLFDFPESDIRVLESSHHPYIEDPVNFMEAILKFVDDKYRVD